MANVKQLTTDEVFLALRYDREIRHRQRTTLTWVYHRVCVSSELPLPLLPQDQIQDVCHKSTALYNSWGLRHDPISIHAFIHRQWLEPNETNRTNLEFSSFLAKPIDIKCPAHSTGLCPTEEIIALHKALCSQADNFIPSMHPQSELWGYNHDQRDLYKVKPLFRSLIMLQTKDHEPAVDPYKKAYRLIRTLDESQLSAPIDFGLIREDCEGYVDANTTEVTTDIITAVNFVFHLEGRENAFAGEAIDAKVLDDMVMSENKVNSYASKRGYTGPRIQGPSGDWLDEDRMMLKRRVGYLSCRWNSERYYGTSP